MLPEGRTNEEEARADRQAGTGTGSTGGQWNGEGQQSVNGQSADCGKQQQVRMIMALKFKFESEGGNPGGDAGALCGARGAWVLDVEAVRWTRRKLDEFRTTNIALRKELEEHAASASRGLIPRRCASWRRRSGSSRRRSSSRPGEVEKVLENRLKTAKADWDKQFTGDGGARCAECAADGDPD